MHLIIAPLNAIPTIHHLSRLPFIFIWMSSPNLTPSSKVYTKNPASTSKSNQSLAPAPI
jgi:hypothetical protein